MIFIHINYFKFLFPFLFKNLKGLKARYDRYSIVDVYSRDDIFINEPGNLDNKIKLSYNEYVVLGDNRGNSMDSRVFGSFSKRKILGKTKLTIFPFSRFGNKE